jgi:ubiquinone/menaquinone biosynthesis C-methylase UbiE
MTRWESSWARTKPGANSSIRQNYARHRVLDIGCGTGSFAVFIKRQQPQVEETGIDPDSLAPAHARRNAERAGLRIEFAQGFADELPDPDASFDRVRSTFMFHHVSQDAKDRMLSEVRRMLKPGCTFHLLDFGGPGSGREGWLVRMLHSSHRPNENVEDRIVARMTRAGMVAPRRVAQDTMLLWRIAYYQAFAPVAYLRPACRRRKTHAG